MRSKPDMAHGHAHGAHDHAHHHAIDNTKDGRRRVAIAAILTFSFMIAEVIGGLVSGSLALLADAAHMLTDAASLALAWLGFKLAERPASEERTFGWARFKVLAAFVNGLTLIALAAWITFEAVTRMLDPQPIMGSLMLSVAIGGLAVNIVAFFILHGGDKDDLNMQGALWHVAGDLLGSIAAIGAAVIILFTGWTLADPILSVLVALIIVVGGVRLVRQTGHILIEGVPPGLDLKAIREDLSTQIKGVNRVTHLHAWALNEHKSLITLDVYVDEAACLEETRIAVKKRLFEAFGLDHATVEVLKDQKGKRETR